MSATNHYSFHGTLQQNKEAAVRQSQLSVSQKHIAQGTPRLLRLCIIDTAWLFVSPPFELTAITNQPEKML